MEDEKRQLLCDHDRGDRGQCMEHVEFLMPATDADDNQIIFTMQALELSMELSY